MEVSNVKSETETSFNWATRFNDVDKEEFSVFLDEQDTAPQPVKESRDDDRDEVSEYKEDHRDPSERNEDRIAEGTSDKSPVPSNETIVVAAVDFPKATDVVSGSDLSTTVQTSAGMIANSASTPETGNIQFGQPLSNETVNSHAGKNVNEILAAGQNNSANNIAAETGNKDTILDLPANTARTATIGMTPAIAAQTNVTIENAVAAVTSATAHVKNTPSNEVALPSAASSAKLSEVVQNSGAAIEVVANIDSKVRGANSAQPNAMETLRTEEASAMSEKEQLSNTIRDLLQVAKGKMSTSAAAKPVTAGTPSLMASETAFAASAGNMAQSPGTETAKANPPIDGSIQAPVTGFTKTMASAPTPVVQPVITEPVLTNNLAAPSAAITGVDQSTASAASQASTAARATMQAGSPAEQVSTQLVSGAKEGVDLIKIQLHPQDLGRVDIKLELGHDGRIMAVISADNADSLDLLQQDSKMLEQALKDAGFDTNSDSLKFSLNQHQEQENAFGGANGENDSDLANEDEDLAPAMNIAAATSGLGNSNLDIQV